MKKSIWAIWLCAWIFAPILANAGESKTQIQLPSEYIVKSPTAESIRLGDLAEQIQCNNEETRQALADLVLMDAPHEGDVQRLAQHQVLHAIRSAGHDFFDVTFTGAKLIDVHGPGQKVTMKVMVDAIQKSILESSGIPDDELSMQILSAPKQEPWLPPQPYTIFVQRLNPRLLGTSRYAVRFLIDQVMAHEEQFITNVARKKRVYIPLVALKRGEVIQPHNVREEIQLIDKEQLDLLYVDSLDDLVGMRCRVNIREYEPVKWTSLETNYVLKRGDPVQMVVRNGALVMHTLVKAYDRGAPGDVISVKADGTGKIVKARVINRNLVEKIGNELSG